MISKLRYRRDRKRGNADTRIRISVLSVESIRNRKQGSSSNRIGKSTPKGVQTERHIVLLFQGRKQ